MSLKLTPDEVKLIQKFRDNGRKLWEMYPDQELTKNCQQSDVVAIRFLRARNCEVNKALHMVDLSLRWRKAEGIDSITNESFKSIAKLKQWYPFGFHKFDKLGRPIYIEQVGSYNLKALNENTTMRHMERMHIKQQEYIQKKITTQSVHSFWTNGVPDMQYRRFERTQQETVDQTIVPFLEIYGENWSRQLSGVNGKIVLGERPHVIQGCMEVS